MNLPTLETIETVNFLPKQDFLSTALEMLREMFWQAPSDSILKLRFEKGAGGFVGMLQIHAMHKSFSATAGSENAQSVVGELREQMITQLRDWKRTRVF